MLLPAEEVKIEIPLPAPAKKILYEKIPTKSSTSKLPPTRSSKRINKQKKDLNKSNKKSNIFDENQQNKKRKSKQVDDDDDDDDDDDGDNKDDDGNEQYKCDNNYESDDSEG